jgi:hypothetical protein
VYLLVFHAYINEMQAQEEKSPVKNLARQRRAGGFNSGVKGLTGQQPYNVAETGRMVVSL